MNWFKKKSSSKTGEEMEVNEESTTATIHVTSEENDESSDTNHMSLRSGFKFVENNIEEDIRVLKAGGEKCITTIENTAETVGDKVDDIKTEVEDSVNAVRNGVKHVKKLMRMCQNVYDIAFTYKVYLEDGSILESTLALVIWLFVCYIFEIWMIPAGLLILFIRNYVLTHILKIKVTDDTSQEDEDSSFKQKIEVIKEIICGVKSILGIAEEVLDRLFKVIDIQEFHLFWLAVTIQVVGTLILMFIPINFLLMFWGISLYLKRFLIHHETSTNQKGESDVGNDNADATLKSDEESETIMNLNLNIGEKNKFGKVGFKTD
ncbi:hypothetical protein HHI36_000873 [Cryptolaemus montrouzieri]|uniref:Reticulon-like protein n=1 Tax=Cryptolaemus montrouzieri TaxID=559131 RepID=A0ABD2P638_9CUCU